MSNSNSGPQALHFACLCKRVFELQAQLFDARGFSAFCLRNCGKCSVLELCLESPWNSYVNVMLVHSALPFLKACSAFVFALLFLW